MRIRRRPPDVLLHDAFPSSSSSSSARDRSAPAPPLPSAPSRASAPCSGTAAPSVQPAACETKLSMCEAAPLDHHLPSHGQNPQGEEKQENDREAPENTGKEGKEVGGTGHGGGLAVHDVRRTGAAVLKVEDSGEGEGRVEAEEEGKSLDARRVDVEEMAVPLCTKGDGKGWNCKRRAQCGYSLCQYHLDKLRSYSGRSQKKQPKPAPAVERPTAAAGIHSRRAPRQNKKVKRRKMGERVSSTRPGLSDSFYYYSGFGPRWGRRRGDHSEDGMKVVDGDAALGQDHRQGMVDAAAGEEEEYDDCDGHSRDGKPFKSRPLSSLI